MCREKSKPPVFRWRSVVLNYALSIVRMNVLEAVPMIAHDVEGDRAYGALSGLGALDKAHYCIIIGIWGQHGTSEL